LCFRELLRCAQDDSRKKRRERNARSGRFQTRVVRLKREGYSRAHHSEIVIMAIDHVPVEVVDNADVRCNSKFQSAAKLTDGF
jgi:hypothetical protein